MPQPCAAIIADHSAPAKVAIALRSGVYPPGQNLEASVGTKEHVYMPQGSAERSEDYELVRFREMVRES